LATRLDVAGGHRPGMGKGQAQKIVKCETWILGNLPDRGGGACVPDV